MTALAPAASWTQRPLLGFDTETTGTDVGRDRIVTVALVHSVAPGRLGETVATWLIDPEMEIPEGAQKVHGISTEHARMHGMKSAEALDEVATMLADALALDVPIVAFNGSFDLAILENELRRLGLPTLTDRVGHVIAPVIDPLVVDRGVDRYRKGKRTLTDLLAHYGIQQDGRLHTADVDVSATLDVLRAIVAAHPQVGVSSLEDLHQQQISWHRSWAENFNEFLRKKGRAPDVNLDWPL
ncbi:exonuclease domain-containing protein [Brachybacterium sp. p3-SID1565]|uniref:DNA polymerase III subunit epsilon n=1 Tax=Brachybacterium epidermidis TaxID=2781983 RepID=A0ABR9W043_9MICO|nr:MULTISPECIES: exonuclease domain-containing protein [Brachybacterium]MBE9403799.1 DNA polymerase III subunit epsilon [Brachybacterium epidermidis]MCT1384066.1 exonuclease domain-containing protein [Brachybacterium sp. p3-SID1565]